MTNKNNPTELAEYFSEIQKKFGFNFDFSMRSLKTEIDKFLNENNNVSEFIKTLIEPLLSSYIGETLCRNYKGEWKGNFRNILNLDGSNYYDCWIEINGIKFWPSHFVDYYLANGKSEESFKKFITNEIENFQ